MLKLANRSGRKNLAAGQNRDPVTNGVEGVQIVLDDEHTQAEANVGRQTLKR